MPSTEFAVKEEYRYLNGFNSYHECVVGTECVPTPDN